MMSENHLHIFSTFKTEHSIECPSIVWFQSILTSLKMKNNVLICEKPIDNLPSIHSTKRWSVNENWTWIAPRAYGPLTKNFSNPPREFRDLKLFLLSNK